MTEDQRLSSDLRHGRHYAHRREARGSVARGRAAPARHVGERRAPASHRAAERAVGGGEGARPDERGPCRRRAGVRRAPRRRRSGAASSPQALRPPRLRPRLVPPRAAGRRSTRASPDRARANRDGDRRPLSPTRGTTRSIRSHRTGATCSARWSSIRAPCCRARRCSPPRSTRPATRIGSGSPSAVPVGQGTASRRRWPAAVSSGSTRRESEDGSLFSGRSPTPTTPQRRAPSGTWAGRPCSGPAMMLARPAPP